MGGGPAAYNEKYIGSGTKNLGLNPASAIYLCKLGNIGVLPYV